MPVSANELAAFNRDTNLFMGRNWLDDNQAAAKWTLDGLAASADVTTPGFDAFRVHDGRTTRRSKPDVQGPTVPNYYLNFDLNTVNHTIDCAAIIDHNLGSLAGVVTVRLQYDSSGLGTFVGPAAVTVATWVPTATDKPKRLLNFNFEGTNERRVATRFWRLWISSTVDFAGVPQISEVILARRYQMNRDGDRPLLEYAAGAESQEFRTTSGNTSKDVDNEGGTAFPRTWEPKDYVDASGLDDSATLRAWWREINWGRRPFIWVETPFSAPANAHFMQVPAGFRLELTKIGPRQFGTSVIMIEESPFLDPELV